MPTFMLIYTYFLFFSNFKFIDNLQKLKSIGFVILSPLCRVCVCVFNFFPESLFGSYVFLFWPPCTAFVISVPWPGIIPGPRHWRCQILTRSSENSLPESFLKVSYRHRIPLLLSALLCFLTIGYYLLELQYCYQDQEI